MSIRTPYPDIEAPGTQGRRSSSSVEQMQSVFHELHADGRNALCAVCDRQHGSREPDARLRWERP